MHATTNVHKSTCRIVRAGDECIRWLFRRRVHRRIVAETSNKLSSPCSFSPAAFRIRAVPIIPTTLSRPFHRCAAQTWRIHLRCEVRQFSPEDSPLHCCIIVHQRAHAPSPTMAAHPTRSAERGSAPFVSDRAHDENKCQEFCAPLPPHAASAPTARPSRCATPAVCRVGARGERTGDKGGSQAAAAPGPRGG